MSLVTKSNMPTELTTCCVKLISVCIYIVLRFGGCYIICLSILPSPHARNPMLYSQE